MKRPSKITKKASKRGGKNLAAKAKAPRVKAKAKSTTKPKHVAKPTRTPAGGKSSVDEFVDKHHGKTGQLTLPGWSSTILIDTPQKVRKIMDANLSMVGCDWPDPDQMKTMLLLASMDGVDPMEDSLGCEFVMVDTGSPKHRVMSWRPDDGFSELCKDFSTLIKNFDAT